MPKVVSPRNTDNTFNVQSYGATGLGSADESAAFQAAANAAMTFAASNGRAVLLVPSGSYKLNSTVIVSGGKVTVDAYGAYIFAGSNKDLLRDWVTQDSSFTLNGFGLIIQGGVWDLKGQNWGLSSNSTLNAAGYSGFTISNSSQVTFRDVTIRNVYNYHGIDINTCEKVLIDGCRLEGFQNNFSWHTDVKLASATGVNHAITGAVTVDGVAVVTGDRVLLKSQTTTTQNGLWVANTAGGWTRPTDFNGAGEADRAAVIVTAGSTNTNTAWYQTAINPTPDAAANTWVLNTDTFNKQSRYFSEAVQIDNGPNAIACKNITVNNCYMGPATDGSGLGSFGKMAGTHTDSSGQFYTNMRFTGNTSVGSLSNAFQGYSFADSVIANNTILGSSERGIRMFFSAAALNSGPRLSITDNVITDTVLHGIEIDGGTSQLFRDVSITGNVITSSVMTTPGTGIHVDTCDRLILTNNSISCTGSPSPQQGIYLESVTDGDISNNTIFANGTYGIQTGGCLRLNINGNIIEGAGDAGIWLTAVTQKCLVSGNLIVGANRLTTTHNGGVVISGSTTNNNNTISNNKFSKGTGVESTTPITLEGASFTGTEIGNNNFGSDWSTGYANLTLFGNANVKLYGNDAVNFVRLAADTATLASTTYADVTGLTSSIPVVGRYRFKAFLRFAPSTTQTVGFSINGPTANSVYYQSSIQTGAAAQTVMVGGQYSSGTGANTTSTAAVTITGPWGVVIDGFVDVSASGTLAIQYKTSTGNIVVKLGSSLTVEKIG